jgi:hypothetical protein
MRHDADLSLIDGDDSPFEKRILSHSRFSRKYFASAAGNGKVSGIIEVIEGGVNLLTVLLLGAIMIVVLSNETQLRLRHEENTYEIA